MSRIALKPRLLALLAVLATGLPAAAQTTYTWTGGEPSDNGWFGALNWNVTPGNFPSQPASDINNTLLVLSGTTRTANVLDYSFAAFGLTYDATAGAFVTTTADGQVLTLGAGGILVAEGNANNQAFNAGLALGANQSWVNNGTGLLSVGGPVTGTGRTLTIGGSGNTTISGAITTGAGGRLIKTGGGVLTLTNNAATGGSNFAAIDASSVVITITGGVVSQPGEGTGTVGSTTATGVIPSAAVASYVLIDGGTLRSTRTGIGATFLATNKGITLGANGGTLDVTDPTAGNLNIYSGIITGLGGLTKSGAGVLALNGTNTYQGATRVAGGTLRVRGTPDRFPTSTALTVDAGAIFDLDNQSQRVGSLAGAGIVNMRTAVLFTVGDAFSTQFSGVIQGLGAVTKQGAGRLTLGGANTYTGVTNLNAGSLALATGGTTGTGVVNVNSNATLLGTGSLSGSAQINANGVIRGGLAGTTDALNSTRNILINSGGTLQFEVNRTGPSAADASRLALAGSAGNGIINLKPGAGNKFTLDLVNGANALTLGETYTLTLATVAVNGNIQFNDFSQAPNAVIDRNSYTLRSDSFGNFADVALLVDGAGTALRLTFTPVPEPGTVLGVAAGLLALGRGVRRLRQYA